MGVFCVNTKSSDFKNTAKRLDIHPDSLEVYVHLYLNQAASTNYMEATEELPFPSDEEIREYFFPDNRESGTKAIDAWAERYGATDGFISDSELEDAKRLFGEGNIHTYMNYSGKIVHRVSRPTITSKKDLKYLLTKLNIIDGKGDLLGISREKFYDRMRELAIPAELYMPFDKELKQQVALVFKRNPELAAIGTEEQYIQYLATIFPNSLDKSIYWHGTNSDFSEGFTFAKREEGSGALETKNRNDFYLAKQAWSVLQYVNGVNRNSIDKNGFAHWNKLWWELKEIMSNGRRENNDWKDLVIGSENVRQAIPNKKGVFNRDTGGENGKWLKERKADYGYENKSDKEFFEEILGVKWGEDTFHTWTQRNAEIFKSLEETEKGIYPAVINTLNPIRETGQNTYYEEQRGLMSKADREGYDAIIGTNTDNEFGSDIAVVLRNNDNVHFLGTAADKTAFSEFVAKKSPSTINTIQNPNGYTQEMIDIRTQAIADGTFMKAPNGKPTNLTERQWLQVRTKAFKDWFGDWEKLAVRNIEDASTVYNELNIDTLIGRQTINNSDSKFEGGLNLDNLPDFVSEIDSHGIAKGNELQRLLDILNNGIDRTKTLYTAPLVATEETKKAAAALGTAGGTSYRGGLFIIAADFGKTLNKDGIGVVFINDMSFEDNDSVAYKTAVKLKNYLQEHYPNIDFRLYSEAKQYYEGNEYTSRQYAVDSVSKVVDENGEPLVVYHGTMEPGFTVFEQQSWQPRKGFYFTSKINAQAYGDLYECFLNIRNPNIYDFKGNNWNHPDIEGIKSTDDAVAKTDESVYDGVIIKNVVDSGGISAGMDTDYIPFSSNQIKSATDNNGEFAKDNDDIYFENENIQAQTPITPIKEEYKGKLIFAQSGSGKTTIADNINVIDSDTILASILGVNTALATDAFKLLSPADKDKVTKNYHKLIKEALNKGKTVVTSSKAMMHLADLIVLNPSVEASIERTNRADRTNRVQSFEYQQAIIKEAKELDSTKVVILNESQYLADIILTDPSFNITVEKVRNSELIDIVESFMNKFGISLEAFSEAGYSIDYLDRIIKAKDENEAVKGAGEMIAFIMQFNQNAQEIISNLAIESGAISESDIYTTDKLGKKVIKSNVYKKLDKTSYIKVLGKSILKELNHQYDYLKENGNFDLDSKRDTSFLQKILNIVKEFLNVLFNNSDTISQIADFSSYVATNVILGNTALIAKSLRKPGDENAGPVSRVNLTEALDNNPYEKDILVKLSDKNITLAGSAAMSTLISIYRPSENPLHDMDFQTNDNINRETLESIIFPLFPNIIHTNTIENSTYTTETYLVLDRPFTTEKAVEGIAGYIIKDSEGNEIGSFVNSNLFLKEGVKGKFLDFFTKQTLQYEPVSFNYHGTKIKVANYRSAMKEKLNYSRLKDLFDFNRAVPVDFELRPSFKETLGIIYNEHEYPLSIQSNRDTRLIELYEKSKKENKPVSLKEIIDIVENNATSALVIDLLKEVAKKHSNQMLKGVKVNLLRPTDAFSQAESIRKKFQGHRAFYNAGNNTIYIDVEAGYVAGDSASVILHEIMHALTIARIANNPEYAKELTAIMNSYNRLRSSREPFYIGEHALEEFIADIWSNAKTIQALKRMKSTSKTKMSLWDKIKNFLKNLLFENVDKNSLFVEASSILYQLLEKPVVNNGVISEDVYFESLNKEIHYNAEQQEAIRLAGEYLADKNAAEDFFLITGKAGTGKTTIINEIIKNETERTGVAPSVFITAVSNKAVKVLSGKIEAPHQARAIASSFKLLGFRDANGNLGFRFPKRGWDPTKASISQSDIIIIDEASMIGGQVIKAIQKFKQFYPNKKFILLGDVNQLPAIKDPENQDLETESLSVFSYDNKREAKLLTRVRQGEASPILSFSDKFAETDIDIDHYIEEGKKAEEQSKQGKKSSRTAKVASIPDISKDSSVITKEGAIIFYKDSTSSIDEEIVDSLVPIFEEAQQTKNPNLVKIVAIHVALVSAYNHAIYKKLHPEETEESLPLHEGDLIMFYNQYGKVPIPGTNMSEPLFFNSDEAAIKKVLSSPYIYDYGISLEEFDKLTKGHKANLPKITVLDVVLEKDGNPHKITVVCPKEGNLFKLQNFISNIYSIIRNIADHDAKKQLEEFAESLEDNIAQVDLGYAVSIHKSLGSTYDVVVVDAKDVMGLKKQDGFPTVEKIKGLYTGITRASNITVMLRGTQTLDGSKAPETAILDVKAINTLINENKSGEEVSDEEFERVINKSTGKEVSSEEDTPLSPTKQVVNKQEAIPSEEDNRTPMEVEDAKWEAIFQEHERTIEFIEDSHEYYYYPQGKEHPESRVKMDTSVTSITNPVERKYRNPNDGLGWLDTSAAIGSSADRAVRDFFRGIDITIRKYPNLTNEQLQQLSKDLKNFKLFLDNKFAGTKYKVVTNPFALVGKITKYNGDTQTLGGTLDILIYDEDGFYYIYDIKTSRNDLRGKDKLNNYTSLVNMYREMLEAMHPELRGCCGGLGILQLSTFYATPKGLPFNGSIGTTMYTVDNTGQLLANGKPIEVHKDYVAPHFIDGDVQKAVIDIKGTIPEQHYTDKRHKPVTVSTIDQYKVKSSEVTSTTKTREDNLEKATKLSSGKAFAGRVSDEELQQIVEGTLNTITKGKETAESVIEYYKKLKAGDILELHDKDKNQSILVKVIKPLSKKAEAYQMEIEYVENSYVGTTTADPIPQTVSRTVKDNINEATVNKKTGKSFSAGMWQEYEDNKREDVSSTSTLDAIINGERTATTRWKHVDGFYDQMKKGDIIEFHDNKGRSILVKVTKAPHKLSSDLDVEEWSKKEGWSVEYFEDTIREHVEEGEAYQLEYEYVEGSYVNPEMPARSRITDITISQKTDTDNYKKGTPQKHKDTAYIFTENALAHNKLEGKKAIGPDVFVVTNVNAGDKGKFNQADIRTNAKGEKTENAFGLIVKKYLLKTAKDWVAQEGCFEDTDEDFELFKKMNLEMFEALEKSDYKKIIFPFEVGLGKAALPKRFAEWLLKQLEFRYGIISTIELNKTPRYKGYGLRVSEVKKTTAQINKEQRTEQIASTIKEIKGENISSKGSDFAKQLTNYGNTVSVEFNGRTYRNAEHAYQTWKSGEFDEVAYNSTAAKPKGSKAVNKEVSDSIMVDILTAKLQQHPELVKGITDRGGVEYLKASTHDVIGDQHWETKNGKGDNGFINALIKAYQNVESSEDLFDDDGNPIDTDDEFDSHFTVSKGQYGQRTDENAEWSDVTLALAEDFTTPGELKTAEAAGAIVDRKVKTIKPAGKYQPVKFYVGTPEDPEVLILAYDELDEAVKVAKKVGKPIKLNIAGNGLSSINSSQEQVNIATQDAIKYLQENGVEIAEIRSGGLTGVDEAGIIAAQKLGIKWSVNAPSNWAFRVTKEIFNEQYKDRVSEGEFRENRNGSYDIMSETLFKERFNLETSDKLDLKAYNDTEEDKLDAILSAAPEITTISESAPKSPLYTEYELQLIKEREALNALKDDVNALFKPSELSDLAKACMFLVSDFITLINSSRDHNEEWFGYLEDSNPRKQELLNTDFTQMDRIEICHKLGFNMYAVIQNKYFNAANNPNGASMKRSLRKKLMLINENFNAFLEMGQEALARLEGIQFDDSRVHIVNELDEVLNGQNVEEITEIAGSAVEHWQVSFRQVSAHASLSQLIKRTLGTLYKVDKNGEKVLNAFGIPERVNESLAINQILMWTQGSENLAQMVDKLKGLRDSNPWLGQIISKLEESSEDETFKSQFWSNFKKYFLPYIIQYQKPILNAAGESIGSVLTNKVINQRSLEKQMLDDFMALQQSRISEGTTMLLFNADGTINETIVKQFGEDLDTLKKYIDSYEENPEEAVAGTKTKGAIERIYRCFELDLDEDTIEALVEDYNVIKDIYTHAKYIKTSKGLDLAIKNKTKDLDLTDKHRNDLESLFSHIVDNSATTLESVAYEDGKLHYSYVTPSYLSNLIDKLKGNTEDYETFLEYNYGKYEWFKSGEHWRNEWLKLLDKHESYRKELQHAVVLTTKPLGANSISVGYRDKSPMLYEKSMLLNYFYGGSKSNWAFYRIPIMSNKPSEEYIRFWRYIKDTYKDDIADLLVNVALQEIDRISTVRTRKADSDTEEIKNFDKNGAKFLFLDYLQPILEDYQKWQKDHEGTTLYYSEDEDGDIVNKRLLLGQMLEQRIQGTENYDNESYFKDVLVSVIKDSMREKFEEYLEDMRKEGLLEQNKKTGEYIHLKDLLMLEGMSVEESLENFFWNDTFAAINILQLTITDIAYYKNAEDLQKRLAQIHAPGLRGNKDARWKVNGQMQTITDGKTRTIYLADFDAVISDAIENIKYAFEKKALRLEKTNPKEAAQYRELAEHIIQAFEDINVTDAEGYNSPTSYRKKAIAFGKWSDELEELYQKIRSGEYTTRDLEAMMQPLKPFVYSNTEKQSVGRLSTLKVGMQNKNSEYLLLMMDAILQGEANSGNPTLSKLAAIYQVMEESHYDSEGNYKTDGIDTVQFNSTVKAGEMGVIDINSAATTQLAKEIIEKAIYIDRLDKSLGYNPDRVHVLEFEDYCIQNEVPAHLEGESIFGSQMRILSISDMPEIINGEEQFISFRNKKTSLRKVKQDYMEAIADNIKESMQEIIKKFNITGTRAERNVALSKLLQEQIKGDSRFGYDLLYSICTDEKGNFNIPLSDQINAGRVLQLLHSIIKTRINKQMIEGGPVVQVTNFGTSKELDIVFKDADGNRLPTLREWFALQDFSDFDSPSYEEFAVMHRYKYKKDKESVSLYNKVYKPLREIVSKRYQEEIASKQAGIMYIECYAPSTVFKQFADKDGTIDLNKIPDEMKKLIGFRIPTEFKYSMAPLKIVGLLPSEAGEGIMLPKDITTLSGSDFDEQKLR